MVLRVTVCASSVRVSLAGKGRDLKVFECTSIGWSALKSCRVCMGGALFLFLVFALAVKSMAVMIEIILQQWRKEKKREIYLVIAAGKKTILNARFESRILE